MLAHRPTQSPGGHDAVELRAHALACDVGELGRAGIERRRRLLLHREPHAAREAHRAQHAQGVLAEATPGVAHRTDDAALQVARAVERVEKAALRVVGHRVDREVASCEVTTHVIDELDTVRMAQVRVAGLHAIGRDLHRTAADHHGNRAMLDAGAMHLEAGGAEEPVDLLPTGVTAHVDVMGGRATNGVANPSAHDPGLIPRGLDDVEHAKRVIGKLVCAGRLGHGHPHQSMDPSAQSISSEGLCSPCT